MESRTKKKERKYEIKTFKNPVSKHKCQIHSLTPQPKINHSNLINFIQIKEGKR